jgi:hypothetical protein
MNTGYLARSKAVEDSYIHCGNAIPLVVTVTVQLAQELTGLVRSGEVSGDSSFDEGRQRVIPVDAA